MTAVLGRTPLLVIEEDFDQTNPTLRNAAEFFRLRKAREAVTD
jgi:hypothetical protein